MGKTIKKYIRSIRPVELPNIRTDDYLFKDLEKQELRDEDRNYIGYTEKDWKRWKVIRFDNRDQWGTVKCPKCGAMCKCYFDYSYDENKLCSHCYLPLNNF